MTRLFLTLVVTAIFLVPTSVWSEPSSTTPFQLTSDVRHSVTIKGQSTVNRWDCSSRDINASATVFTDPSNLRSIVDRLVDRANSDDQPATDVERVPDDPPPQVRVSIPVRSFDCGRKAMNEDMYESLRADSMPNITYLFYSIDRVLESDSNGTFQLGTVGGLSLAGEAKTMEFPVTVQREGPLTFGVKGSIDMKMTDFGIEPPTALLGLIKAYDDIKIRFRLQFSHQPSESAEPIDVDETLIEEKEE